MNDKTDDQYSERETQRRMNEAVRRALNTPPQPKKAKAAPKKKGKDDAKRARRA